MVIMHGSSTPWILIGQNCKTTEKYILNMYVLSGCNCVMPCSIFTFSVDKQLKSQDTVKVSFLLEMAHYFE